MANISQIAQMLNLSPSTVSRAIKKPHLVSPKTRKKVLALADETGYLEDHDLQEKRKYIGILVPTISNSYFSSLINIIQKYAYANDLIPIIAATDEQIAIEKNILQQWATLNISGILAIPTHRNYNDLLPLLNNKPLILIDRDLENSPFDCVCTNNVVGLDLAYKHLKENGHNKIAFITGSHYVNPFLDQLKIIEKYGNSFQTIEINAISCEELYLGAFEAFNQILAIDKSKRPTAIIAASDSITSGLLYAINQKNLKIYDDISLVSYGDIDWMSFYTPSITTIRKSKRQIGQKAISLLIDKINGDIEGPKHFYINPNLKIRNSVKKL